MLLVAISEQKFSSVFENFHRIFHRQTLGKLFGKIGVDSLKRSAYNAHPVALLKGGETSEGIGKRSGDAPI
jgi:hypothetical protein